MAQVSFHGNIGQVRGLQFAADGSPRFSFSVGEGHSKKNRDTGQWDDSGTTWRNVTVFGKRAEALAETVQEGAKQQVVVMGREETRDYEKSDGSKGSSLDCVGEVVGIIPKAQPVSGGQSGQGQPWDAPAPSTGGNGGWGNPAQSEPPF